MSLTFKTHITCFQSNQDSENFGHSLLEDFFFLCVLAETTLFANTVKKKRFQVFREYQIGKHENNQRRQVVVCGMLHAVPRQK